MSSSLFYDCYAPYETYAETVKIEGCKNFSEIKIGDILYIIEHDNNGYHFVELKVINPWHEAKGKCYISCLKGKKKFYINFGTIHCGNVIYGSKYSSIVFYDGYTIGTDKESLYNYKHDVMLKHLENIKEQYDYNCARIKSLELLKNNI